jgi:hypothetical protein
VATFNPTTQPDILPDVGYVGAIPYAIIALIAVLIFAGIILTRRHFKPAQKP